MSEGQEATIASEAEKLEYEIFEKTQQLAELRRKDAPVKVPNYAFETATGTTSLKDLFAGRDRMLVIHNMGQACRYCTLWADGINGALPHLEDAMAVLLVSKDPPDIQQRMAADRRWRFRIASHGGGEYMTEQCAMGEHANMPGATVYELSGDEVHRRARTFFGPGDLYCPVWHFLALAGVAAQDWTPQYHYWQRPQQLEDGGENVLD